MQIEIIDECEMRVKLTESFIKLIKSRVMRQFYLFSTSFRMVNGIKSLHSMY
jgi:hypothetical protein